MTIFTNLANNTKTVEKPEVVHPEKPSISFKIIIQFILLLAIAFDALILVHACGEGDISKYSTILIDIAYFIGITLNSPHILATYFTHQLYNFFWYAILIAYPVYFKAPSSFYFLALCGPIYVAYLYMVFNLAIYEIRRWVIKKMDESATPENEELENINICY